jgi:hypothetical protein
MTPYARHAEKKPKFHSSLAATDLSTAVTASSLSLAPFQAVAGALAAAVRVAAAASVVAAADAASVAVAVAVATVTAIAAVVVASAAAAAREASIVASAAAVAPAAAVAAAGMTATANAVAAAAKAVAGKLSPQQLDLARVREQSRPFDSRQPAEPPARRSYTALRDRALHSDASWNSRRRRLWRIGG